MALTFAGGALWLGSSGAGCKVLTLSAARRKPHAAFGSGERRGAGETESWLTEDFPSSVSDVNHFLGFGPF